MNYCIWILDQRLLPLHFCVYIHDADAPTASLCLTFLYVFRDAQKSFAQKEENAIHSFGSFPRQFDVL